jgi:hypothetical protein
MMDLSKLQQDFAQALFSGDAKSDLGAQGELSAAQRVGIYRNSVHGILSQHLAALYPVCRQLIGEQRFDVLCDTFIDQHSPDTPYLPGFGEALVDYLKQHAAFKTLSWVVDVAQLEWARHAAWHSANQPVSDFSKLAQFDEAQQAALCFALPQSAQLLHVSTAADEVWLAHQSQDIQQISAQLATIQLDSETTLIIWRQGRSLQQSRLTPVQWRFLRAIQQGVTLEGLSSGFEAELATLLATAVQQGWVCSFI